MAEVISHDLLSDLTPAGAILAYDESVSSLDGDRDTDVKPDASLPQWEVYMNGTRSTGKLLHMSGIDDSSRYLLEAKLSLEIGEPGSFTFTITPNHVYYNNMVPYGTFVNVYQEGVELFRGRVTGFTTDINGQRQVTCEGDLSYLEDVIFPNSEINTKDRKLDDAFGYFIRLYNKFGELTADDPRYFFPGDVNIEKAKYMVKVSEWLGTEKSNTEFTDARSLINEFVDTFGGYLRTKRLDNGYVALEYISGYTDVNNQTLSYGSNLIEFSIDSNMDDLFTVLIPLGDEPEDSDNSDEAITVQSVATFTDSTVKNATISHTKGTGWKNRELVWDEGVKLYGRIMKQENFAGITTAGELKTRAVSYFRECITGYLGNYTIKAVDLHYLDPSHRPIYLGQKVRIVSAFHGIDTNEQPLTCMKIDYDFANPETVSCEFDIPFQPLTDTFTSKYKEQQAEQEKEIEDVKKKAKKANKVNNTQTPVIEDLGDLVAEVKAVWNNFVNYVNGGGDVTDMKLSAVQGEVDSDISSKTKKADTKETDIEGKFSKYENGKLVSTTLVFKDGSTKTVTPSKVEQAKKL